MHGTWYYQIELPPHADGTRRAPLRKRRLRHRHGRKGRTGPGQGTAGHRRARRHRDSHPDRRRHHRSHAGHPHAPRPRPGPQGRRRRRAPCRQARLPPGEWLEEWLAAKKKLRPGTVRGYAGHIRLYLKPHLGHIPIDRLRVTDVAAVFDHIAGTQRRDHRGPRLPQPGGRAAVKGRRRVGPATCQRIRATLRSALSAYMKQHPGALPANVASLVELPPGSPAQGAGLDRRAGPRLAERLRRPARRRPRGRRAGQPGRHLDLRARPSPVMVWTPAQTMVFLEAARRHRLHALWRLITTRGLRRGEGCGLRRPDTDLGAALSTIRWQITQLGWDPVQGAPKSDAGERTVALDADTVTDMTRLAAGTGQGERSRRGRLGRQRVRVHRRAGEPAAPRYGHQLSSCSPTSPGCRPSACTTCATAPRPCCWPPGTT